MRVLGYYFVHTVVNAVKKLFRTWVAILLGICLLFGVAGGIVGVTLGTFMEEDMSSSYEEMPEEEIPPMTPEEKDTVFAIIEAGAGGLVLLIFLWSIYRGDKSGSNIFTMPDVNFLFASPMRPQSVLLFRVVLQMGSMMVAFIYLAFQIPNLMLNMGLDIWTILSLFFCLILTIIISRLLAVFTYTLAATHQRLRRYVRPAVFAVGLLLILATVLTARVQGLPVWEAALWLFGDGVSRFVPGWGWLKGAVGYTLEGNVFALLLCYAGTVALAAVLVYITWRLKADFYEDALDHATELFNTQTAAAEGRSAQRKKERPDRVKRDGLQHGQGASVFFFKGQYNHHRMARFRVLTGTGFTFLGIYLLWTVFCCLSAVPEEIYLLIPGAVALFLTFFRNMAGPLEQDLSTPYFIMVPESAFRKVLFSMLAGSYEILMNLLPGLILSAVVLRASLTEAVLWLLTVLTLDFFCSATRLFLSQLLPSSLPTPIQISFLLMFKMLLVIIPLLALIIGGFTLGLSAGLAITSGIHIVVGGLCLIPAVALLHEGEN